MIWEISSYVDSAWLTPSSDSAKPASAARMVYTRAFASAITVTAGLSQANTDYYLGAIFIARDRTGAFSEGITLRDPGRQLITHHRDL